MNFSKKLIAGVTSAFLMLGTAVAPIGESGAFGSVLLTSNAETYSDYEYQVLEDGTVEITKYSGSDSEIAIPSKIDGKTVTSIGDWAFEDCTKLESVTIPNSVTNIDRYAFYYCINLKSITIPNSVTSIGDSAFYYCTNLESITIANSVTSIGDWAFDYCTSLESITIPNSVTSIGEYAFNHCTSLESINIPNSVTSIGEGAFDQCSSLASITIPKSVTSIGYRAFCDCTNLKSITIPNSVTSIGDKAFGYYYNTDYDTFRKYSFNIYGYTGTAAEKYAKDNEFNFIPLDGTENAVTLNIELNASDKTMSAENVSISVDGGKAVTASNGSAELSLADGAYEITFSAHGFVPRTYTVEIKDGKLTEELTPELNLIGDADGNGVVNTLDIVKLKRHLIKVEPLTGYALDCANTDGNDTLNTLDIVKLKRHLINVEKLW